jgi:predicted transposase YbfD/YdcC
MTTVEARACRPSSPIPPGLTVLGHAAPLRPAERPDLLASLATVTDPRARAGRRHPLVAILVLAAAAVLAGARSITAIAEWAADAPQPVRAALGTRRDPRTGRWVWAVPTETTIRRTLGRVDPQALAAAIGSWLADRDQPDQPEQRRRAVAVDGKTLRGARRAADGRQAQLLAAMDHATRVVLAQRQVDGAPGEVPAFQPLLADPDLAGAVVTADALHTHPAAAWVPGHRQAGALPVLGQGQGSPPCWPAALACPGTMSPWGTAPVTAATAASELRTLKVVTVHHFGLPHTAQVLQVTRKTRDLRDGNIRRWRTVVVYAITSLAFAQASPARLANLLRGHWAIENGLHWVRDVTLAEDASRVRTGTAPQVMAWLRNLIIGVLWRAGPVNLAAALRRHARDPRRPLATLGISPG